MTNEDDADGRAAPVPCLQVREGNTGPRVPSALKRSAEQNSKIPAGEFELRL